MSHPGKKWTKEYLKPLVGATIASVGMTRDGWPTVTVEKDGCKAKLEVARDLEGNGPGVIHGLAWPKVAMD